ncbi:lipid-A-disaccharide synthase [Chitiniphilus shinanonensis]|uniref:Lipid-A-disaccharide synthase n=1 Tax=Chitiniphilus shinanonensis TaxID=553088 RepID=A0ABQ6BWF3_9NEIS|nr:lipid-A-disaccharide synthase [Chitiniphilus shinanonensis]GLS04119.1 lipid-A-disaccharide synthase [Chitiniphilus shinanonensis]
MNNRLFDGPGAGPKLAIVAGEASGDLLGADLIRAVRERMPDARFAGIAGPKMMAAGAHSVVPMSKLAVRGYAEVLKHLPELLGIRRRLKRAIAEERPDLVIGIDAPDFNLGLERAARSAGLTTVHYVSPSVWAWRAERLKKIGRAASHVLLLFPFEAAIYRDAAIPATYVGHPLADQFPLAPDQKAIRELLDVPEKALVFAFLPGSRVSELEMHAELFVRTAKLLAERYPHAQFLVPLVTRETRRLFEDAIWRLEAQQLPFRLMFGHAHEAMMASDAILVASGTAALEAMLAKRPTVVTYRISGFTYWLVKRKLKIPYVSLPNVLAGERIVPELLQHDATPEKLSAQLAAFIDDSAASATLVERFTQLHESLRCGGAERAADAIVALLRGGR